ncbi:unnamed protein product [Hapterophycus canaliculatus]
MSTAEAIDGLTEKGETRVMGLGVGVFLIFIFSMVAVVACLVGATTPRPGTFACAGTGLLGFVILILLVAEQDSRYVEDKSDQIQDYDHTFYPRLVAVVILALAALLGLGALCVMHIGKPVYATPVYDQRSDRRQPIF